MRVVSRGPAVSGLFRQAFRVAWITAIVAALFGAPVLAQVFVPSVPGSANPYLSGMPAASACCGGDVAPAQSPVQVTGLSLTPGSSLTFSVTGSVEHGGGTPTLSPDGADPGTTPSNNGISGATWPIDALVGVFLDGSQPDSSAAPTSLDFTGNTNFTTLSPALKQAFFIGDGLTGTGSGATQQFIVPAGATRLFLGTSDGFGWFNNVGSFAVTVTEIVVQPETHATGVPTLSLPMLAVLLLALAAIAGYMIRRRA